ncbi:MAG: NAD(P)-binding protein [Flavobacteriales bacterium]|nr:NAD(P)-binding protein [Flavobacteriales bacterium]
MSSTYDVIISGAGPAGSTAALHLKSSGLRVLLLDKASFPRDKICGDALSGTVGFELSKLGLDVIDTFVRTEPKQTTFGLRFISPGRHTFDLN